MSQILNTDTFNQGATFADANEVILIRATYSNEAGNAGFTPYLFEFTGAGNQIILEDFGSVISRDTDTAILFGADNSLTVNAGSMITGTAGVGIDADANALDLVNYGLIRVASAGNTITQLGSGSRIDNYGEISNTGSGGVISAAFSGVTLINNHGTVRAATIAGFAFDLSNNADTINNYGTIFGTTLLLAGADAVTNHGTMTGLIDGTAGGAKSIINYGVIGVGSGFGTAISLGNSGDVIANFGTIAGTLALGDGSDEYRGQGSATAMEVNGGGGEDVLIGSSADDRFLGGADNDFLFGSGGDDYLDGDTGDDDMSGGSGNDTFVVDSSLDQVHENVGDGRDTVLATTNFTLAAGEEIEFLTNIFGAVGLILTGNEFVQTITGAATGHDTLAGGGNGDTLIGRGGDDTYMLANFTATIIDSGGTQDAIRTTITRSLADFGAIEALILDGAANINGTGNGLDNTIIGNVGRNIIDGGAGIDTITGVLGNDTYKFTSRTHSPNNLARDTITDFDDPGMGNDRIDVSKLFGPAMTYRHTSGFNGLGQVRVKASGADVIVEVNCVGSLAADFSVKLTGTTLGSMNAGDFVL
jgi:hypothetical protein